MRSTTLILLLIVSFGAARAQTLPQKISETQGGFGAQLPPNTAFGKYLDQIGDFNGDGVVDLAVGSNDGVWLVMLNRDGTVKDQILIEPTGPGWGTSVAGIGDLDDDGVIDLVIGAASATESFSSTGAVYVVFLNQDGTVKGSKRTGLEDILGDAAFGGARFGYSAESLGDVDGDGVPDLAIGMSPVVASDAGSVFILFMNRNGTVRDFTEIGRGKANFAGMLDTSGQEIRCGTAIAVVGDLDENGVLDLAFTCPYNTTGPNAFVVLLDRDGSVIKTVGLPVEGLVVRRGQMNQNLMDMDNLGDLDGDGVDDLIIGEGAFDTIRRGRAWIVFLNRDGSIKAQQTLDPVDPIHGIEVSRVDQFGTSVAGIGDLNGDGIVDLAVGADGDDDGGPDKGAVWIIFSLPQLEANIDLVNLTDLTEAAPAIGRDVLIEAELFGVADIASAEINFRRGGDPSFFSAPMTTEEQNRYSFSIPAFAVSDRGLEYFVTTTNSAGVEARAPTKGVVSIPVRSESGISVEAPSGTTISDYRLISFPLDLDDASATGVLMDDLGPVDPTSWRLYSLTSSSTFIQQGETDIEMEIGRAYFMLSREAGRMINSGPGITASTDTLYAIALKRGWNLVGNPFNFEIPVSNLTVDDLPASGFWTYDGTWRQETTVIRPFEGYALFAEPGDTLWVDPDLTDANQQRPTNSRQPTVDSGQRAQLETMMSKLADDQFGNGDNRPSTIDHRLDAYPNPFASDLTISYELSKAQHVGLTVFDMLGRRVSVLEDRQKDAGSHSMKWTGVVDGTQLADGLYLLQLRTGTSIETRSISLTRQTE